MLHKAPYASARQRLSIDFITLKHACPKGVYVAPASDNSLVWTGVVFVRKGPYAKAVLRFEISFAEDYPSRPPIVTFLTDVFHPLVAPLTTYTYTSRDKGVDTISAADQDKLPPGGLGLRHGFPEWYGEQVQDTVTGQASEQHGAEATSAQPAADGDNPTAPIPPVLSNTTQPEASNQPHIIEVLQYMRVIFDTDTLIDEVPLEAAANPGAWHAWKSFRARSMGSKTTPPSRGSLDVSSEMNRNRSMSPNKQQPGGARRPGEWNWTGVWEDRVKKAVQASIADTTLFGGDESRLIDFVQLNDETYRRLEPIAAARAAREALEQSTDLDSMTV